MNKTWLDTLDSKVTNNVKEFLKVLEIDFKNIIKICVSGNSSRVTTITTLKDVLNTKKFYSGVINFSDIDNEITYKNKLIDAESLEFHLGCIKTVSEETKLDISKEEALFLAALNFFREQKAPIIIVEDAYSFIKDIEYDHYLLTDYSEDKNIFSYSKIDSKDLYLYKSELCSFNYINLDYDAPNYGSFNALSYTLAIAFIYENYPEIKPKKIRNFINDMKPNMIYERVNMNPRVIINYLVDSNELDESINNLKNLTDRNIIKVSNIESNSIDYVIKDVNELSEIIKNADINDIIYIAFDKLLVKDIRHFFIN